METVIFWFAATLLLCRAMIPAEQEHLDILAQSENIKVLQYTLILNVDPLNTLHYYEVISHIKFECIKETSNIYLSKKQLETGPNVHIGIVTIQSPQRKHIVISDKGYFDLNGELYPIKFEPSLEAGGTYKLRLGFYKPAAYEFGALVKYNYIRGDSEKVVIATRSGATSAKELFYSLDDADMNAQFMLLLMHKQKTKSFSNMPSITQSLGGDWAQDEFEESHAMPTFSFGFVVGDFVSKDYGHNSVATVIRVSSDESVLQPMQFAGEMALKIFRFYTDYFKFNYADKKLDIIALPDYDRVEKENYGYISIGESYLLNPNPSVAVWETSIVLCLCDAIVHQWIGMQTTTFPLNEYWLDKGLILYFQAHCLREMNSETGVKYWNSYIVRSFARVLDNSAETSRPIYVSENRLHLSTLFLDTYTAEKGHHIIRMMKFVVGNTFEDKFITFFKNHQSVSTNLEEVLKIFDPVRNVNVEPYGAYTVAKIMNHWLTKSGLPLVTVKRSGKKIMLKQERFTLLGDTNMGNENTHWVFPFSYTTESEKTFINVEINHWLEAKESSFKPRNKIKNTEWIIYNGNLNVPCRINYEMKNWELLQKTLLKDSKYFWISPEARARLILDMFALAENGKFADSYKFPLTTIKYLQHEDSHLAWIAAMHEVNKIQLKLRNTEQLHGYKDYMREILTPVFARNQFKTITHIPPDDDQKNFKKLIITSACTVGVDDCVEQCRALFKEWMANVESGQNNNPIPLSIRDIVSCQAIKHGGREEWNFLWDEQAKETNILAKRKIYEALGCTNNLDRLEDYMDYWIDEKKIVPRDFEVVFNSFLASEAGYIRMKRVFIERLEELTVNHDYRYQHGSRIISYFVKILEITNNRADKKALLEEAELRINRNSHGVTKIKRVLDKGSKKADRNILWLEKHLPTFSKNWLKV